MVRNWWIQTCPAKVNKKGLRMRGSIVIVMALLCLTLISILINSPQKEQVSDLWEGISLSECVIGPPNHCEDKS